MCVVCVCFAFGPVLFLATKERTPESNTSSGRFFFPFGLLYPFCYVCSAFCVCVGMYLPLRVLTDHSNMGNQREKRTHREERKRKIRCKQKQSKDRKKTSETRRGQEKESADGKYTIWSSASSSSPSCSCCCWRFLLAIWKSSSSPSCSPSSSCRESDTQRGGIRVTRRSWERSIKNLTQPIAAVGSDERDCAAVAVLAAGSTPFPAIC